MEIKNIPFTTVDWDKVPVEEHKGIQGRALWKTVTHGNVRARIVIYTHGYLADHWCEKGHVIFVLEGEFVAETRKNAAS